MEPQISKARRRRISNTKAKVKMQFVTHPTEDEIESVEYLEECHVADASATEQTSMVEDTFYPNAIHCLISMYHTKYEQLLPSTNPQQMRTLAAQIWQDISKDMRDCYFDFNALQVQQKFAQLRQKYFSVSSKESAEEFEYFQPFHAIYQSKLIAEILTGETSVADKKEQLQTYHDDLFFVRSGEELSIYEDQGKHDESSVKVDAKRMENIAHKENEVLDLVERELQAMEQEDVEIKTNPDAASLPNAAFIKHERPDELTDGSATISKRFRYSGSASDEHLEPQKAPTSAATRSPVLNLTNGSDMSLAAYNAAQQQRHDEKMSLMRQSLLLQEHAIEVQRQLLEQLIKRL